MKTLPGSTVRAEPSFALNVMDERSELLDHVPSTTVLPWNSMTRPEPSRSVSGTGLPAGSV
jgi:hypothetical protein